jgi:hypothetical protein
MGLQEDLHREHLELAKEIERLQKRSADITSALYALTSEGQKKLYPRDVTCP